MSSNPDPRKRADDILARVHGETSALALLAGAHFHRLRQAVPECHHYLDSVLRFTAFREAQALATEAFVEMYRAAGTIPQENLLVNIRSDATSWLGHQTAKEFPTRLREAASVLFALQELRERHVSASTAVGAAPTSLP